MSLVFSDSTLHSTRALIISGGLASIAALLAGVLMLLFMKKKNNVLPKVAGVVAGIFNIAAGNYLRAYQTYRKVGRIRDILIIND